jgi:integrase
MPTSPLLLELFQAAANDSRQAPKTRVEYAADWKAFVSWCAVQEREALPASTETLIDYLSDRLIAGAKVNSAARAMYAINDTHRKAGLAAPGVRKVADFLTGVRRLRCEQPDQKRPLDIDQVKRICSRLGSDPRHVRARAILTLGFFSALRRSNIVALNLEDVRFVPQGMLIRIRKEKQDQEGKGRTVGVATHTHPEICPTLAMQAYLQLRGGDPGPVFLPFEWDLRTVNKRLDPKRVGIIVKDAVKLIDLDPVHYAGHSMRSGFVTAAVLAGISEFVIASQTGHKSLENLRRYYRISDPFARNASALLGL